MTRRTTLAVAIGAVLLLAGGAALAATDGDPDPTLTDPEECLRRFGQRDHVRRYGPDFEDRLREAGFHVRRVGPADVVEAPTIRRMRMPEDLTGHIFPCTC